MAWQGRGWGGRVLVGASVAVVVIAVGYPAVYGVMEGARWLTGGGRVGAVEGAVAGANSMVLLGRTVAYAVGISVLATLLAWPAAWGLWGRGGRGLEGARGRALTGLMAVPLLLPNYFAYAGWGLLRGPRTRIGDWLASGPAWRLDVAGKAIAVWGLGLWAWPLAMLVLWLGVRRVSGATLESLAVEGAPWWARARVIGRQVRGAWLAAVGVVTLVMLGSLVPLDVANVPTYSVTLLRLLSAHEEYQAAWVGAWPLVVIAVAAGWVVTSRLRPEPEAAPEEAAGSRSGPARWWRWCGAAVWGLSVVAPGALFVMNMREPPHGPTAASIVRLSAAFWREYGEAVVISAGTAAAVGAIVAVVSAAVWYGLSAVRGRGAPAVGRWTIRVMVVAGLTPGVLIGSVLRRAWDVPWGGVLAEWVGGTTAIVVLAHAARFGFVGALIGWWLSRQEAPEVRDLRAIDGADALRGWLGACGAPRWAGVAGAALGAAVLSFHEIEAAVQVSPPGAASLAQKLLEALHYARDERLAAGAVNLMGAGVVCAIVVGWMLSSARRERRSAGASRA